MFFSSPIERNLLSIRKVWQEEKNPWNSGIRKCYDIDEASWIWHPDFLNKEPVFLLFKLSFEWTDREEPLLFSFSADQYAELCIDGELVARGPEASPPGAHAFASFEIAGLSSGDHCFEVFAWWLGSHRGSPPMARETCAPGFILSVQGGHDAKITTGKGPWRVVHLEGLSLHRERRFGPAFGIGDGTRFDARQHPRDASNFKPAAITHSRHPDNPTGERSPRYCLRPSRLPEQLYNEVAAGKIRAVINTFINAEGWDQSLYRIQESDTENHEIPSWQELLDQKTPLFVPANSERSVLLDLEDYFCGFSQVTVGGGENSEIVWTWAESLFHQTEKKWSREELKGNRSMILGKSIRGPSDTFIADGGIREMRGHWWRSGRYCLLRIQTAAEPLQLREVRIQETRYPLETTGFFQTDRDEFLQPVQTLCKRGLEMCAHETYVDCPHYEQLMYVFDTRLEMLTTYVLTPDARLPMRAIELFDMSRERFGGAPCARFPSLTDQCIPMFCLAWTWMIRDHLLWRGDEQWLRQFLSGTRAVHDWFENYEDDTGVVSGLPGWNFIDWVKDWPLGVPPQPAEEVSVILNAVYVYSLRTMAELESRIGDPMLSERFERKANRLGALLFSSYWDETRGLLKDDPSGANWSQHAQIWGILSETIPSQRAPSVLERCLRDKDLAPASYMLRSYLFDAMFHVGQGHLIMEALDEWAEMVGLGAKTGFEHAEPTRSDCHGWSSHPLYHLYKSIAGIFPTSPGFKTLEIAPQPGKLQFIRLDLPHPAGRVEMDLRFQSLQCEGRITLPAPTTGVFRWNSVSVDLVPGENRINCSGGERGRMATVQRF